MKNVQASKIACIGLALPCLYENTSRGTKAQQGQKLRRCRAFERKSSTAKANTRSRNRPRAPINPTGRTTATEGKQRAEREERQDHTHGTQNREQEPRALNNIKSYIYQPHNKSPASEDGTKPRAHHIAKVDLLTTYKEQFLQCLCQFSQCSCCPIYRTPREKMREKRRICENLRGFKRFFA